MTVNKYYDYNDKYSPYNVCGYEASIVSGVLTLDFQQGTTAIVDHNQNITSVNILNGPTYPDNVGEHTVYLTQDTTGNRTLTGVTLNSSAGNVNIIKYMTTDTGSNYTAYNETAAASGTGGGSGNNNAPAATIASGVLTLDHSAGDFAQVSHSENITSVVLNNAPTSGKVGSITVFLNQDATGGRTLNGTFMTISGAGVDISTAASAKNIVNFITVDGGSTYYAMSSGKAYS